MQRIDSEVAPSPTLPSRRRRVARATVAATVIAILALVLGIWIGKVENGAAPSAPQPTTTTGIGASPSATASHPTPSARAQVSTRPAPTRSPTVRRAGFPNASNTGVPDGVKLTPYAGPTTISSCGAVIDGKLVSGSLTITAGNNTRSSAKPCVTIKNSLIRGKIDTGYAGQERGPLLITDSEIDVPIPNSGDFPALSQANYYAWRLHIHGAAQGANCDGYCEIHDSYIHDQYYVSPAHLDAFISNGNYGAPVLLDHNTLRCNLANPEASDGNGGCSAAIGLFGDFSAITNFTVSGNLLQASRDNGYCAYTGADQPAKRYPRGTNLRWTDNTFERGGNKKCGSYGPVADWRDNSGNVWRGNKWNDGTRLD